ncbi:MAG: glycosyltransferase family 1 protein [Proteobacteria bacterium]|nr:glycosyltransferase family 1 protein [Pseudomonadota bacterium]
MTAQASMGEAAHTGRPRRRILFLSLSSTQFGGGEVFLFHLVRHALASCDVFVACAAENRLLVERMRDLDVSLIEMPLSYRQVPAGVRRLVAWHARERFDLVYANGRRSQLFGSFVARRTGLPMVGADLIVHLPWSGGVLAFTRNLLASLLNRVVAVPWAVRIITICEFVRQELVRRFRVSPEKVVTVWNAVDAEHFAPQAADASFAASRGIAPDAAVVVCSARLVEHKGQAVLIDAIDRLRRQGRFDGWLVLIGDGPDEARLRARIAGTSAPHRCIITDFPMDIRPWYARADVVVLASREEGLPTALLQAMSMARPVVGTNVQGIPESVTHGENGLLVPVDDPAELSEALARVLADREAAVRMGEAGRQRVLRDFRLEIMLARFDAVLDDAMRAHAARGEGAVHA